MWRQTHPNVSRLHPGTSGVIGKVAMASATLSCIGRFSAIVVAYSQSSGRISVQEVRMSPNQTLRNDSRRTFLKFSVAAAAASAFRIVNEPMLAAAAVDRDMQHFPPGAVVINANENPLGPCDLARKALADIIPEGGRYCWWLKDELTKLFAESVGVKPEYTAIFPGSSEPLHFLVMAFTSPTRSYVTADPGYESGMHSSQLSEARVVKVPLTKTYAHDIPAMIAAAPDAGLFYVCTPNNPTGTPTPHLAIEELLAKKPKGSIVLVDEAYIHFADLNATAIDLVKAGQDLIVLRTFSKIYGMAGIRCGAALARPDLHEQLIPQGRRSAMPITPLVAAVMKNSASVSYALPSRSENSPHRDGFLADGIMFPRA